MLVIVVALLLPAVEACRRVPDDAVAGVGPRWVGLAELQHTVEQGAGEPWPRVDERVATRLFDQLLDRHVLLVAAEKGDVRPQDPGESVSVEMLVKEFCPPPPEPDPEQIERRLHEALRVPQPTRVRVRQLLLRVRSDAESARQRLLEGEPFEQLSAEVSSAPNAAQGGGLGIVTEGDLPPEFEDAIFPLETGAVSEPVEGPAGYHIFQVVERFEHGDHNRDELRSQVAQELLEEMERAGFEECLQTLASDLGVHVYTERLWFHYDGRYVEESDAES